MTISSKILIALLIAVPVFVQGQSVLFPNRGGTGSSDIPSAGDVLVGQSNGTFAPQATSTLGISGGGGGLDNVVEDTTPQLGGDLDVNGNNITSTTGLNVAIGASAGNDFTVDTDKFVVEGDTGNVGIGDVSPASLFTVGNGDLFQVNSSGDIITQSVGVDALESEDFGDFTCNGTTCSLDSGVVDSTSILNGTIVNADINASAAIDYSKLTLTDSIVEADLDATNAATDNQILSYDNATGGFTWVDAGSGDVVGPASATDDAIARFDSTTGKLIQNSGVTIGDSGNIVTTIADGANVTGLTINQNDVTNEPPAIKVIGESDLSSPLIQIENSKTSFGGANLEFFDNVVGGSFNTNGFSFTKLNSIGSKQNQGFLQVDWTDDTDGSEDARIIFYVARNGNTSAPGFSFTNNILSIGDSNDPGVLESSGSNDLVIRTGNSTTGNITLTDGANGAINIAPNGTGEAQVSGQEIIDETMLGRSLTYNAGTVDADAELYTRTKTMILPAAATADAGLIRAVLEEGSATTITEVKCEVTSGTSATIQLEERADTTPTTAGTDIMTSTLVCDADSQNTTSFTNASIAAGSLVSLQIDAQTGDPDLAVHITYTVDD